MDYNNDVYFQILIKGSDYVAFTCVYSVMSFTIPKGEILPNEKDGRFISNKCKPPFTITF